MESHYWIRSVAKKTSEKGLFVLKISVQAAKSFNLENPDPKRKRRHCIGASRFTHKLQEGLVGRK